MTWKLTPSSLILFVIDGKFKNRDSVDTLLETIRSVAGHTGLLVLLSACIFTGLTVLLSDCMFIWMHLCTAHCLLLCPFVPFRSSYFFSIVSFIQIYNMSLIACTNYPSLSRSSSKPENYQLFFSSSYPIFSCPLPLIFSPSLSHFY